MQINKYIYILFQSFFISLAFSQLHIQKLNLPLIFFFFSLVLTTSNNKHIQIVFSSLLSLIQQTNDCFPNLFFGLHINMHANFQKLDYAYINKLRKYSATRFMMTHKYIYFLYSYSIFALYSNYIISDQIHFCLLYGMGSLNDRMTFVLLSLIQFFCRLN